MPGRQQRPQQPPAPARASRALHDSPGIRGHAPGMFTFPDLRGLLLVALVCAWLAGILLASIATFPFWLLVAVGVGCIALAALTRWLGLLGKVAGGLALGLALLACATLGAARLTLASPLGDASAVSSFIGRGIVTLRGTVSAAPEFHSRSIFFEVDT